MNRIDEKYKNQVEYCKRKLNKEGLEWKKINPYLRKTELVGRILNGSKKQTINLPLPRQIHA